MCSEDYDRSAWKVSVRTSGRGLLKRCPRPVALHHVKRVLQIGEQISDVLHST